MTEHSATKLTADQALKHPMPVPSAQEINETTQLQMALDVCNSLAPVEETIDKSPQETGFRKDNTLLEITGLSPAAQRAVDVAYFIVAQNADENELYYSDKPYTYSVDLSFFNWLLGTSSRNWAHLRSALREAQRAAIEVTDLTGMSSEQIEQQAEQIKRAGAETTVNEVTSKNKKKSGKKTAYPKHWISVQLIGSVALCNDRVNFEVNPILARHIKNAQSSHSLSLSYVFKSLYAKTLYTSLLPYARDGGTPWMDVEKLKKTLECATKTYEQFKFFKQLILLPAIREINAITDIEVAMQTRNIEGSRKIGYLRFEVTRKHDAPADPKIELKEIFQALRNEFGLSNTNIDEVLENSAAWTNDCIRDAMDYTRYQIKRRDVRLSPGDFLMKVLREHYKLGTAQIEVDAIQSANPPL